jgi:Flp pilus assembly protein protease CpaA
MFEIIAVVIAMFGSAIAGIWDLFTTEVPDEIPAIMLSSGIVLWYFQALSTGDFIPLFYSLVLGTAILILGLILYKKGHWGGADAWLFAAIAFLLPVYKAEMFIIPFVFNFLIVGTVYIMIYAIILGLLNRFVFSYFIADIRNNWKIVLTPIAIIGSFFLLAYPYADSYLILVLLIALILFWRYALVIENRVFKKRIRSSELKQGDVLEEMIWKGITEEEIKQIREKKDFVVVKEGVRFVPVFPIALAVTLLYGNLMFLII